MTCLENKQRPTAFRLWGVLALGQFQQHSVSVLGVGQGLETVGLVERFLSRIGVEAARDPDAWLDVGLQVGQGIFHQQTADALPLVVRTDDHVGKIGVGAVVKEDAGDACIAVSVADGDDGGGVGQDLFRLGFCQRLKVDGRAQLAKCLHWDGVGDHKGFVFHVVLLFTT